MTQRKQKQRKEEDQVNWTKLSHSRIAKQILTQMRIPTWALQKEHVAKLPQIHQTFLLRVL